MNIIKKVFHDAHTGIDGKTYDWGRLWGSAGALAFLGLSILVYGIQQKPWDPVTWGTGMGLLLSGTGLALLAKQKTEPPKEGP